MNFGARKTRDENLLNNPFSLPVHGFSCMMKAQTLRASFIVGIFYEFFFVKNYGRTLYFEIN